MPTFVLMTKLAPELVHDARGRRAMGKAYQAWSAASFLRACHDLHLEPDLVPVD